jgi:hypothetical protein
MIEKEILPSSSARSAGSHTASAPLKVKQLTSSARRKGLQDDEQELHRLRAL